MKDIVMRSPDTEPDYQPFRAVKQWFEQLTVILPDTKWRRMESFWYQDDTRDQFGNLLRYFDTGINQVLYEQQDFDEAVAEIPPHDAEIMKAGIEKHLKETGKKAFVLLPSSIFEVKYVDDRLLAYKVTFHHGNEKDPFEYGDESEGTQRLFEMIPLYQRLLGNGVVLIDEIDRSLHTKAAQAFIQYFYELTEGIASQLIVTTHDSNIMDLDFVRQDEIWFVERQGDHSSKVYSLNQFKARFDRNVEKEYLIGRYGALPVFWQSALEKENEGDADAQ